MSDFVIACDVDDTVLNLMPDWLKMYNEACGDNLTKEQVTDWDISQFAKEGKKIYEFLKLPHLFRNATPIEGALDGVKFLRTIGARVVFVTFNDVADSKLEWLHDHGFLSRLEDFYVARDKSLIRADIIIDDNCNNVISFTHGRGILVNRPWNVKYDYTPRAYNWGDIVKYVMHIRRPVDFTTPAEVLK